LKRYLDQLSLSGSEKKYIDLLYSWNLENGINEKGATVFRVLWDSLETAVWNDEIAAANMSMPWPDESTLLESLLRDTAYKFADDIRTLDTKETMHDAMKKAVALALPKIEALDKANKLAWGAYKATHVDHLTKTPALSRLNLPIGGGVHIINATTSNHGPSWRMIVHLTDEVEAYGVYPGGQSGNPGSKFYDSFVDNWAAGKYYRLQFVKKEQAAKSMPWHIQFTN
jgi:penicillin amidase